MEFFILLIPAIVAYMATSIIYRKVLKLAKVRNVMDNPNERKLHDAPVPVLGGMAVFFGILAGLLAAGVFFVQFVDMDKMVGGLSVGSSICDLLPVLLAASILLFTGCVDDLIGLSPLFRLIVEILAITGLCLCSDMCVDSFFGLFGITTFSRWIGLPLTVFVGVGIINAYNMVDGVDGLSSGLCITVAPIIIWLFQKRNDWVDATLVACYMASLIPFFMHNVFGKKSRMFIGDAGTMVMGLLLTWCVIKTLSSNGVMSNLKETDPDAVMCLPAMLFSIASVPVMDTLRVIVLRKMCGKSAFMADRRHLHHKFVDSGISHSVTTLSEIVMNLLVVLAWYVSYKSGLWQMGQLIVTLTVAMVLVWGTYLFLDKKNSYNTWIVKMMKNFTVISHLEGKPVWKRMQKFLDKGTYEDLTEIVMHRLGREGKELSENDMDVINIMNFMQDKNKVYVTDIVKSLNIDNVSVQSILVELERNGLIQVLASEEDGSIIKLTLCRKVVFDE